MEIHAEELAKLKAHRWQVSCLDFKPDGSRLATGGWDKEVHIWDLSNLEVVVTLKGAHHAPITSLSWKKPYGDILCTGSADCTAVLWNPEDGKHIMTLSGHQGWILGTSFSASGHALVTASWDKTLQVWDPNTGALVSHLIGHTEGVWSVDFHPISPDVLCSGSEDGSIRIWDLRSRKTTLSLAGGHSDAVYCAKWSHDGTMIASGSADTKICIWEPIKGLLINTIYGHTDTVKDVLFNPNADAAIPILASAGDYTALLSDPRPTQRAEIVSMSPHTPGKEVEAVAISPDGSVLVTGGRDGLLVLITLSVPLLRHQAHNNSISSRLRNSLIILERSFISDSVDDLIEAISQDSNSEKDVISTASMEDDLPEIPRRLNFPDLSRSKKDGKKISARESRLKRTEKKLVDLPTIIAHLSTSSSRDSVITEQLSSSSESSEDDLISEEQEGHQQMKVSGLINVAQKVNEFSEKTSLEERERKVPKPRLSLLPKNAPETVKEYLKIFESGGQGYKDLDSTSYGSEAEEEEEESSYTLYQSDHYSTGVDREDSFAKELGSGDEYDETLSII